MRDEAFGLRDFAKSMMSCAWAIAVFGMRQMTGLLSAPGQARAKELAQAADKVTDAATATFGDSTQTIYRAGTSIQNAVIDVTLGSAIFDAGKLPEDEPASSTPSLAYETLGAPAKPSVPEAERGDDWILKVQ
jgi:hypothetical protein